MDASSIAGYLSILCWLIVFTPQLWENYVRKSGDGLSVTFLVIWLAGDVFNLLGVIMQDLLVTMFVLALYYTVADMALIWQVFYYKKQTKHHQQQQTRRRQYTDEENPYIPEQSQNATSSATEASPLLKDSLNSSSSASTSTITSVSTYDTTSIDKTNNNKQQQLRTFTFFNTVSFLSMFLVTVLSCYSYYHIHNSEDKGNEIEWLPQLMGWTSAILYVGSRIPQLLKNWKSQSTEGLSIGMFFCAVMGNVLFSASIFLKSTEKSYLLMNLSWLVGSCGTLIFDFIIFVQFFLYKEMKPSNLFVGKVNI